MEPIENYRFIEMIEPSEVFDKGIPFELIILVSVISGGSLIGLATLLLIRRKRKRIE